MIERVTVTHKNVSKRFLNTNNDYSKQYCALYNCRLKAMRELLVNLIKERKQEFPICNLHELTMYDQEKCFIIGTLFKEQKLKPSVLKQLHSENNLIPQPVYTHFTSDSDVLYIEDESQRFKIEGNVNASRLVTGITCALLGTDLGDGKFDVDEIVFINDRPTIPTPISSTEVYLIFISGLDMMHTEKHSMKLQLFHQWVAGLYPCNTLIDPSLIARIIITGNSISSSNGVKEKKLVSITNNNVSDYEDSIQAVKTLDEYLMSLCQTVDVDIMPGENDPSNHILPQRSLHSCMLPKSSVFQSLNCVSNPYDCEINGYRILGTSGQPVDDIARFSDIVEPIEALESSLKWGSIAPTAPDTLPCYPSTEDDPFVLDKVPNVYFSGNHEKFNTKKFDGSDEGTFTRLICVPDFSATSCVAVLNLKDLDCSPVYFDA